MATSHDTLVILRRHQVEERTGLSRALIYKLMPLGQFPRPVKLTAKAVGWKSTDVAAWINSRPLAEAGEAA